MEDSYPDTSIKSEPEMVNDIPMIHKKNESTKCLFKRRRSKTIPSNIITFDELNDIIKNTNNNININEKTQYNSGLCNILGNLYMGNSSDASNISLLQEYSIKYILCVAKELPPICYDKLTSLNIIKKYDDYLCYYYDPINNINIMHLKISDYADEKINNYFELTNNYINSAINSNQNIFIHCNYGISRAPTIVIAYLMEYGLDINDKKNISYDEALDYVRSKRNMISPNIGFTIALYEYDKINSFPFCTF